MLCNIKTYRYVPIYCRLFYFKFPLLLKEYVPKVPPIPLPHPPTITGTKSKKRTIRVRRGETFRSCPWIQGVYKAVNTTGDPWINHRRKPYLPTPCRVPTKQGFPVLPDFSPKGMQNWNLVSHCFAICCFQVSKSRCESTKICCKPCPNVSIFSFLFGVHFKLYGVLKLCTL